MENGSAIRSGRTAGSAKWLGRVTPRCQQALDVRGELLGAEGFVTVTEDMPRSLRLVSYEAAAVGDGCCEQWRRAARVKASSDLCTRNAGLERSCCRARVRCRVRRVSGVYPPKAERAAVALCAAVAACRSCEGQADRVA